MKKILVSIFADDSFGRFQKGGKFSNRLSVAFFKGGPVVVLCCVALSCVEFRDGG